MNLNAQSLTKTDGKTPSFFESKTCLAGLLLGIGFFTLLVIYTKLLGTSNTPMLAYYHEQAQAWLDGQLNIDCFFSCPDLTSYKGLWYVPFPPLPSLLMLPWVWAFGAEKTNTVLFSMLVGSLNVSFIFFFLMGVKNRGLALTSNAHVLWMTLLFGVGSVHFYMSIQGTVWYLAQICAVSFVLLAAWASVKRKSPWLVGFFLGMAMLGRPHLAFLFPFFLGLFWNGNLKNLTYWGLRMGSMACIFACGLLVYNHIRFEDFSDFGYLTQNISPSLKSDLLNHGQFHWIYFKRNVYRMFLAFPTWFLHTDAPNPNFQGLSIFCTTPAFIYAIHALKKDMSSILTWLSIALVSLPLVFYYNTGWAQFGYRFSLDFMIPLVFLLCIAGKGRNPRWFNVLILVGTCINLYGAYWFATAHP